MRGTPPFPMKHIRFPPFVLSLFLLLAVAEQAVARQLIRVPLAQYTVPSLGVDGIAPITGTFSFGFGRR